MPSMSSLHAGKRLQVVALDLSASSAKILQQIGSIAAHLKPHRCGPLHVAWDFGFSCTQRDNGVATQACSRAKRAFTRTVGKSQRLGAPKWTTNSRISS